MVSHAKARRKVRESGRTNRLERVLRRGSRVPIHISSLFFPTFSTHSHWILFLILFLYGQRGAMLSPLMRKCSVRFFVFSLPKACTLCNAHLLMGHPPMDSDGRKRQIFQLLVATHRFHATLKISSAQKYFVSVRIILLRFIW